MTPKNFGYSTFREIIESVYRKPLNYKLFSKNVPDHYVDFTPYLPSQTQWHHPIEHKKLKHWEQQGLNQTEALHAWERLIDLLWTLWIDGKNNLPIPLNLIRNQWSHATEMLEIIEAGLERLPDDETFESNAHLEPIPSHLLIGMPIVVEIDINGSLSTMSFHHCISDRKLVIQNPLLLLESLSHGNECFRLGKNGKIQPTINSFESSETGQLIQKELGRHWIISFEGITIHWIGKICAWPPSIDALFCAQMVMQNANHIIKRFCTPLRIADVGCGTGFMGIVAGSVLRNTASVTYTDTESPAVRLALYNHKVNCQSLQAVGYVGFGYTQMMRRQLEPYDLIICNAPYVIPEGDSQPSSHPVISSGLLEEVISGFPEVGRSLIMCSSPVGSDEFSRGIKILKSRWPNCIEHSLLGTKYVPFRVKAVSRHLMQSLVRAGKLIDLENSYPNDLPKIMLEDNRGYRYWHQLQVHLFLYSP